jgi:SWI/SNF-related matrix-associated actin-dependent regulator 1 of chromatin subfamily A
MEANTIITLAALAALTSDELLALAQQLHAAVRALAGVCDGAKKKDDVGFSASDTSYGRAIAAVAPEAWTAEDVAGVSALCRTYKGQLAGFGIDVDALPRVGVDRHANYEAFKARAAAATAAALKTVALATYAASAGCPSDRRALADTKTCAYVAWVEGQDLLFQTHYDVDFTAAVKALSGRRWDGARRIWVAAMRGNAAALLAILDRFEIACPAVARALLAAHAADAATPAPQAEAPKADHVTLVDGQLILRTPYSPEATAAIKDLQGRRWDGERRVWVVKATAENCTAVQALAGRFNWRVAAAVATFGQATVAQALANVEASRAADAEVTLTGLAAGVTPYPFQKAGIAYAVANRNVLITDDTGLGKTPQAMITVEQLGAYPCLVIAPKAVKRQWRKEIDKFLAGRTSSEVNGKIDLSGDFVIVNYAQLSKLTVAVKAPGKGGRERTVYEPTPEVAARGFRAIIVDECQAIKDAKTQQSGRVKGLSLMKSIKSRLLLTATPIMNRPVELVHQLDVLGRLGEFGGFWAFVKQYCKATQGRYGWDLSGASNLGELNRRLRATCMVRREKADVVKELPALQRTVVPCEIRDKAAFADAMCDAIEWLREAKGSLSERAFHAEALVRINALRQMAAEFKLASAVDWIEAWLDGAEGQKLVVFAHHKAIQGKLLAALAPYGAVALSGESTDRERADAVDRFWKDPACRVIVCSLKAAGVGLNLQCAGTVAFVEFGWHAADMNQAEGRVHRIGSEAESINSYWLAGEDTFDTDMIELIESKRAVADAAVIGAGGAEAVQDVVAWFAGLATRFMVAQGRE